MGDKVPSKTGFFPKWIYILLAILALGYSFILFIGQYDEEGFSTILYLSPVLILCFVYSLFGLGLLPKNRIGDYSIIFYILTPVPSLLAMFACTYVYHNNDSVCGLGLGLLVMIISIVFVLLSFVFMIFSALSSIKSQIN